MHLDVKHQQPLVTKKSKTKCCIFMIIEHKSPRVL